MAEKPSVTLPGTVEKIIKPQHPSVPEKAQISVEGGDDLYREIRIVNSLTDESGNEVALKKGSGSGSYSGSGERGYHSQKGMRGNCPKGPHDKRYWHLIVSKESYEAGLLPVHPWRFSCSD